MNKLYRSSTDRYIGGVCGGMAEYFNIDSAVIRIIWALSVIIGGSGLLFYLIAWVVIPIDPVTGSSGARRERPTAMPAVFPLIIGVFFIFLGISAMGFNLNWHIFSWARFSKVMWILLPVVIILLGALLIFRSIGAQETSRSSRSPSEPLPDPDGEKSSASGAKKAAPKKSAKIKEEPAYSKASGAKKKTDSKKTDKGTGAKKPDSRSKRLYRNMDNRMISGVCSGLADYMDIDVSIVRVLWVIGSIMTGFIGGIIAYLAVVFIVEPK